MKIGDLVICHCGAAPQSMIWYKGLVGMIVGFELNGIPYDYARGAAVVFYDNGKTVHLIRSGLQVVS